MNPEEKIDLLRRLAEQAAEQFHNSKAIPQISSHDLYCAMRELIEACYAWEGEGARCKVREKFHPFYGVICSVIGREGRFVHIRAENSSFHCYVPIEDVLFCY